MVRQRKEKARREGSKNVILHEKIRLKTRQHYHISQLFHQPYFFSIYSKYDKA